MGDYNFGKLFDRLFKGMFIFGFVVGVLGLVLSAGGIYVAVHFISKFW